MWFSPNNKNIDVPLNSISVFDVAPVRSMRYMLLGAEIEASVSTPFTSTVIIAREMENLQCAMIQQGNCMQSDDCAEHSIPIFSTVEELEACLSSYV